MAQLWPLRPLRLLRASGWVIFALAALLLAAGCTDDTVEGNGVEPTATGTPLPQTYTVVSGDTLASIASRLGLSVAELVVANELPDPDLLEVGQVLLLPSETPASAAGSPPPALTCADHRSLIEDALSAAELIEQASTRGGGSQYAPYLDDINRVSGLLVRRSEASTAELDALLRILARLAIDATRLSLGQVSAAEADVAETAADLRAAGDAVLAEICATSSPAAPLRPQQDADERPVHPSRETGVA